MSNRLCNLKIKKGGESDGEKVAKTTGCNLKKSCAEILLAAISIVAEKNAAVLCRHLIYEPTVPKKLKK